MQLKDVTYQYPHAAAPTLRGATLEIHSGSLAALWGANGCGKSTLAAVAVGLLAPQSGEVVIRPEGGVAALMLQNPDDQMFAPDVRREVAWGMENLGLDRGTMGGRVKAALERFGLAAVAAKPPEALSDGEKQLVVLASLWAMRPAHLILDEPTAFLDAYWADRVREAARELATECGVLWITSRQSETRFADEVYAMAQGVVVKGR